MEIIITLVLTEPFRRQQDGKKIKTSTQTIWYWATADGGKLLTNSWLDYNGNSYYLKADGKMAFNEMAG